MTQLQLPEVANTIVLVQHGSHLYGTNTETSDLDYKGVYQASLSEILLNKAAEHLDFNTKSAGCSEKNTSEDRDLQYKELRKFINDALAGQIYALDLLFAPEKFWIKSSDIWEDIVSNRAELLSSNIKPFVGYARQQAAKYGLKGSRLAEVIRFRDFLRGITEPSTVVLSDVLDKFPESEYVFVDFSCPKTYFKVLEKKFQLNTKVSVALQNLEVWISKYGQRTIQAMEDEGVDYKAVSHALRCVWQATELLSTGFMTLPLPQADFLREVKQGKHKFVELQNLLSDGLDGLNEIKSVLPEKPNVVFFEEKILNYYGLK